MVAGTMVDNPGEGARLGDVVLLGVGASTQAAASYLAGLPAGRVSSITAYTGLADIPAERLDALRDLGVRVVRGTEEVVGLFDLAVASPGVPCTGAFYGSCRSHCRELVSEPELAWRESPRDWVAVTGTNGKTTTTTLVRDLLLAGGVGARAVGNIGVPPICAVDGRPAGEVFVAELSSFQLENCHRFHPHAAVLLNVTPDHVEWHGSLEAYAAAKERVFCHMGPGDVALLGPDETCRSNAAALTRRGVRWAVLGDVPAPGASEGAWVDGEGRLTVRLGGRDHALCRVDDLQIKGPHNVQNALAAAACALEMGAPADKVAAGLAAFAPLAHRIEHCGFVDGVAFVDDSKGTNTDAAAKAVGSFEPGRVVVLLGGHDKGTDLTDLAREVAARCRAAVAYGEAGERMAAAVERAAAEAGSACRVARAPHMREAFDAARGLAQAGDTVLLSPACSSFDEFSSYKQRGEVFQGWVRELAGGEGAR